MSPGPLDRAYRTFLREDSEPATWTIERGADHPSRIVLPMRSQ